MLKNTKPKIHKIIFPIMCASLVKFVTLQCACNFSFPGSNTNEL